MVSGTPRAVEAAASRTSSGIGAPKLEDFVVIATSLLEPQVVTNDIDAFELLPKQDFITPLSQKPMIADRASGDNQVAINDLTDIDRPALIHHCTSFLLDYALDVQNGAVHEQLYKLLFSGLTILDVFHDVWHTTLKKREGLEPIAARVICIQRCMDRISLDQQLSFWRLLEVLHGTFDWVEADKCAIYSEEFEVSTTVWLLEIGPQGLAMGWLQGLSTAELALASEQRWLEGDRNEAERATVANFAKFLREWSSQLLYQTHVEDS